MARKGAVGGTARWVADAFWGAVGNKIFDIKNCSTNAGLEAEIDKIVQYGLAHRFQSNPSHPDANAIYDTYKRGHDRGLTGFTIAILAIEADYFKNTTNNMIMFDEVIVEELRKKNVGEAMISGQPV